MELAKDDNRKIQNCFSRLDDWIEERHEKCFGKPQEPLIDPDDDDLLKRSMSDHLLSKGFAQGEMSKDEIRWKDIALLNRIIVFTWPLFALFLLSQPWLSNLTNNSWWNYSPVYTTYAANGSFGTSLARDGICSTPASKILCTNGENFTALAIAAGRVEKDTGLVVGCGCGEGVLGEGLCPLTFYGFTLSDFVSTEPAIGAMLGLGLFPLLGTWENTKLINALARPRNFIRKMHMWTMIVFQMSYIAWGICSCCIFPTSHALLTVVFLGSFLAHWVVTAFICLARWGMHGVEARITFRVALFAVVVMGIGAVPRLFLTINGMLTSPLFPNWNRGIGSYAFWFAEAAGLSATFGAYPMICIAFQWDPDNRPNALRIWNSDTVTLRADLRLFAEKDVI